VKDHLISINGCARTYVSDMSTNEITSILGKLNAGRVNYTGHNGTNQEMIRERLEIELVARRLEGRL
jgi:hypothetical protein